MRKVLITGTNSFVGGNFIKYSRIGSIDEVSLLDNTPGQINFGKYDVVLHLVAIVHQTKRIPESEYYRVNHNLCIEVAREAKKSGVKQFVFLSTVKVYGKFIHGSSPWNEASECLPDDSYGKSKYEAEKSLRKLEDDNFTVSVIRTPLVYGEGVKANMLSIMKLINNSFILPFRGVNNRRNFTSAENLIGFIDRIIEKKSSGIFIAMDEDAISTSDLVKMISKNMGKKIFLFGIPNLLIKIGLSILPRIFDRLYGSFEMDNSETLTILDFKPPVTINDGIKKMVVAFMKNDNKS